MSAAEVQPVLAEDDAAELRQRWERLQTRFVDEPQDAVREADKLVTDVFENVTRTFTSERESWLPQVRARCMSRVPYATWWLGRAWSSSGSVINGSRVSPACGTCTASTTRVAPEPFRRLNLSRRRWTRLPCRLRGVCLGSCVPWPSSRTPPIEVSASHDIADQGPQALR